jgi:hypothetical protein
LNTADLNTKQFAFILYLLTYIFKMVSVWFQLCFLIHINDLPLANYSYNGINTSYKETDSQLHEVGTGTIKLLCPQTNDNICTEKRTMSVLT